MEDGLEPPAIITRLQEVYDGKAQEIESDVVAFVDSLTTKGLLASATEETA